MHNTSFTEPKTGVTFDYPEHWIMVKEENETYLFYDEMKGSFRITPFLNTGEHIDQEQFLANKLVKNIELSPQWLLLKNRKFIYYRETKQQDERNIVIHYYWAFFGN